MDASIPCPRCGARLRLPHDPEPNVPFYTCPRCLASVPNPEPAPPGPPPGAGAIRDSTRSTGVEEGRCPYCAAPVQADWRVCPHCAELLREDRQPAERRRSVEADVRLDQKAMSFGTVLLALLGAITLCVVLFPTLSLASFDPQYLTGFVPPLGFLVAVFAIFFFRRPQEQRSVSEAMVRTLATVGVMVGVLLAFVILLITVCLAATGGRMH